MIDGTMNSAVGQKKLRFMTSSSSVLGLYRKNRFGTDESKSALKLN